MQVRLRKHPTDYFASEITTVGKTVVVSNTRGVDALRPGVSRENMADVTDPRGREAMDRIINGCPRA